MLFTVPPERREIGIVEAYLRTMQALIDAKKGVVK